MDIGEARYLHTESNQELLRVRAAHGDLADIPRQVDHTLLFRRRHQASAAAAELTGLGFQVEGPRRRWFTVEVQASREEPLDPAKVAAFTEQLQQVAHANGGQYDGWGAVIVTEAPAD